MKPSKWVQGKLRMLKNQKAITSKKMDSLLLSLDDLQLKVSELKPFQRLTLEQAGAVVEALRRKIREEPGQDPSVHLKATWTWCFLSFHSKDAFLGGFLLGSEAPDESSADAPAATVATVGGCHEQLRTQSQKDDAAQGRLS